MKTQDAARTLTVAVIAGDGIGKEIVPPALEILELAGRHHGLFFDWRHFDWGSDRYLETGQMMPPGALEELAQVDQIFLGAIGHPDVPDTTSLWQMLIPIRRAFAQYVNLRPIRLLRGLQSPLRLSAGQDIDLVCVRENNEGEYSEVGGRVYQGTSHEFAIQESIFTRHGVERVSRYALAVAARRKGRLVSATKSNGILHTMPFWDEVVADVRETEFPEIEVRSMHVDALAAKMVLDPGDLDVILASNLFGDILTDLAAALVGSLGLAPSANLNPEGKHPSMFEPVHGSAPDIAGRGVANPLAQIWTAALMMEHLGRPEAGEQIVKAIEGSLVDGICTPDLGGGHTTTEVGSAVLSRLERILHEGR